MIKKLVIAVLAASLIGIGIGIGNAAAQQQHFDNVTLRVATFPGTWATLIRSQIGESLEAQGIKLEFIPGTSAQFLAKLVASKGQPAPFDVVEIADEDYADFRAGKFVTQLDLAKIPNVSHLGNSLYDDYHVANWLSEPSIVYNVDKFKEAGIPAPQRFSDLENPKLQHRVLVGDMGVYVSYYEITALAYENGGSEASPAAGFAALKAITPHSATSSIGTVAQLFQSGDIWAAIWPAHIAQRLAAAGLNVSVVHPQIKGKEVAIARGYVGVVANSPQADAAEYYINALLAPAVQTGFYKEGGLTPVNNDVLTEVAAVAVKDKAGVPFAKLLPGQVANAWWPDYRAINKRDWARQFDHALAAN
jgi:ABC-type Fe3+ transport system substrate-binding protein